MCRWIGVTISQPRSYWIHSFLDYLTKKSQTKCLENVLPASWHTNWDLSTICLSFYWLTLMTFHELYVMKLKDHNVQKCRCISTIPDHILTNIDQVSISLPVPCSYDGKSKRELIGMVAVALVMQWTGWRTLVTDRGKVHNLSS